jgi:hypothetical protein
MKKNIISASLEVQPMSTITLAIPEEMRLQMNEYKVINWSEVAREAIRQKLVQLNLFKSIVSKSKLTERKALDFSLKLGREVNKSLHERMSER